MPIKRNIVNNLCQWIKHEWNGQIPLKTQLLKLTQEEIHCPLKKKNNVGKYIPPDFSTHYKAILFKVVWYSCEDRQINSQWNRRKCPEVDTGAKTTE